MKKINIVIVLLLIVAGVLQGVQIFLSNKVAVGSIEAKKIGQEIARLSEENTKLKSEILQYASFDVVASKAAEFGFVETEQYISLYDPLPVAFQR